MTNVISLLMKKRKKEFDSIMDDIGNEDKDIVIDSHELTPSLYKYIKSKDKKWLDLFYNMVISLIDAEMVFDTVEDFKSLFLKSKNFNKEFIEYFFDGLKLPVKSKSKKVEETDSDTEEEIEDEDDQDIKDQNNKSYLKDFKWRAGQLEALDALYSNGDICGIMSMITGIGKSNIILKNTWEHSKKNKKKGSIYILLTPKIEIFQSLFFEKNKKEYELNKTRIKR